MGLFDVFSFKGEARRAFSKENFITILTTAKDAIICFAKENMPGEEKKKSVDVIVTSRVREVTSNVKNNLVNWLINRIIDLIPVITQLIYEFLKEKVENL